MQRYLTLLCVALLLGISACEKSDDDDVECKECKEVVREDGQVEEESSYQEYCGDELDEKEEYERETGNRKVEYECRS